MEKKKRSWLYNKRLRRKKKNTTSNFNFQDLVIKFSKNFYLNFFLTTFDCLQLFIDFFYFFRNFRNFSRNIFFLNDASFCNLH